MKEEKYKAPAPKEFVPTELGSAVFASVEGRPQDEDYLLNDSDKKGDANDTGNPRKTE